MKRWLGTVAIILALAALLGLGTWQLARLDWKRDLIATMERRMAAPAVAVETLADNPDSDYRRVTAHGRFDPSPVFFLFALSDSGQGGYHLLQPLRLADGRRLLVDRGWLPYDRQQDVFMPAGEVSLAGILRRPQHSWNQPANNPARNEWYGVDLPVMAGIAGISAFLPTVLEVDAAPNPGGYPHGGQTRVSLPNNHLGYALTWYGLAVALLVITVLARRRGDGTRHSASASTASPLRPDAKPQ